MELRDGPQELSTKSSRLEKSLESPVDSKDNKQLNHERNKKERKKSPGTLCGGIDAEIEEPIVWPIWGQVPNHCERPLAEKDLVQEEKGTKEDSSVQSFSHVQLFATPWTATYQASLPFTNSQNWFKLMSIESVMPSNHLILCCPLLLPPWIFPSIRVFSNESVLCIRCPKYWTFSFYINPSNEYSGLISFRMDWLDPLAVQRTLKSLLQHHSSKASILWCSAFKLYRWRYNGIGDRFNFLDLQHHCGQWLKPWKWKTIASWMKSTCTHDYWKNHSLD